MEFLSRSDDKKLRWIITESCPQPRLFDPDKQPDQEGEGKGQEKDKGEEEVKGDCEQQLQQEKSPTPHKGSTPPRKEAESAGKEPHPSPMEVEKPSEGSKKLVASRGGGGGWRSRRGRGKGDRGAILLTSLEQEMLDWALGGFLPAGPEGLRPSSEHQVQVQVIPVDKEAGSGGGAEGMGSGDPNEGEEPPRKRAKVMLLQVMRKGDSVYMSILRMQKYCIGFTFQYCACRNIALTVVSFMSCMFNFASWPSTVKW